MEDKDTTASNNDTDTISAGVAVPEDAAQATDNAADNEVTAMDNSVEGDAAKADISDVNTDTSTDEPTPTTDTLVPTPAVAPKAKKSRAKWLIPVVIVGALLVIAGGAYSYMGVYLQSPQNLWSQALKNTGGAIYQYSTGQQQTYSGAKINGTYKVVNPTAADGTITAAYDGKSTTATVTANVMGIRANLEVLAVTTQPATSPDIYLKVSGIKSAATLLGGNSLAVVLTKLDSQWYYIDHTLTANLTKALPTDQGPQQLQTDVQDVSKKVGVVLQDRLFTTDNNKSVLVTTKTLGKEDFKGRKTQKYQAQVRKPQLKDMVNELQAALKDSKANAWIVGNSGKTFEQQTDIESLQKQIDSLPQEKLTAEVWVDIGLKYIRNVRIAMPDKDSTTTSTLDIFVDYTGGNAMPVSLSLTQNSPKGNNTSTLGITVYKGNSVIDLSLAQKGNSDGQNLDYSANIKVEPSNDSVTAAAPAGAKNIMELLGGLLGSSTSEPTTSQQNSFFDNLMMQ